RLAPRIAEPVRGPDAVHLPAEPLEHLLAQPVAIAGGLGRVVRGSVALDREQVAPRMLRVHHGEVEMVTGDADLRVHVIPVRAEGARHLDLEVRLWGARGEASRREVLLLREPEIVAQHAQPAWTGLRDAQRRRLERA